MMREYVIFSMSEGKYVRMQFNSVCEERNFLCKHLTDDSVAYCICYGELIGAWVMIEEVLEYISYM